MAMNAVMTMKGNRAGESRGADANHSRQGAYRDYVVDGKAGAKSSHGGRGNCQYVGYNALYEAVVGACAAAEFEFLSDLKELP